MELSSFIESTLRQIIEGVERSQIYAEEHNAYVNPYNLRRVGEGLSFAVDPFGKVVQFVEFDVAVSAAQVQESQKGGGIIVGALTLGARRKDGRTNNEDGRVKFVVPLSLPVRGDA